MQINNIFCGEYSAYYLTDSNTVYTALWNNTKQVTQISPIPGMPTNIVNGSGGLHNSLFLDNNSNVWTYGDNTYGQQGNGSTGTTTDPSQVKSLTGVTSVVGWMFTNLALKADGTVWIWGQDSIGIFGGNILTPRQLSFPSGVMIEKIIGGYTLLFLDTQGNVWQWLANTKSPTQVKLPGAATDIAASTQNALLAIVGGYPYGWGDSHWGLNSQPISLKSLWGLTIPIVTIVGNDNTIHYIDSNGDLWGVGDNVQGEIGNGDELNFSIVNGPNALFAWNWGRYQRMITKPVHIIPGVKFKSICTQNSDVFYVYAQDTNSNWFSWGRNKGYVLGNNTGLSSNMAGQYPNIADQPTPAIVTPLTMKPVEITTLAQGQKVYFINTGYSGNTPITTSTTTTSSTTKPPSTTTTTTSSTSTTSTTTTTSTTVRQPYIVLYKDGTWVQY